MSKPISTRLHDLREDLIQAEAYLSNFSVYLSIEQRRIQTASIPYTERIEIVTEESRRKPVKKGDPNGEAFSFKA